MTTTLPAIASRSAAATALPPCPASADELLAITLAQWQSVLEAPAQAGAAWMAAAAKLGHADAQAVLGQWCLDGHGVARDSHEALPWFLCAAQRGHAMGMNMAGRCHEQGWGTPADAAKAAHWYRLAAARALPEAQYNLANLLVAGRGVPCDAAQAFALYRDAAGQGYVKAYAKLGRFFEDGLVVARDESAAFEWYRRGAEGGDFRGQFSFAGMLAARGREAEALHWLAKVPDTATPRYLRDAGARLLESAQPAIRAIGERMRERALALAVVGG